MEKLKFKLEFALRGGWNMKRRELFYFVASRLWDVLKEKWVEYLAMALGIGGAILNACLMVEGFYLWVVGNILWIYLGVKGRMWGMVGMFAVYTCLSIWGIIYWGSK